MQVVSLRACESEVYNLRAWQLTSCGLALQFVSCELRLDQPECFHRDKVKLIT